MSGDPEFSVERQIDQRLERHVQEYWFVGHSAEQLWRWQIERRYQLREAMRLELPAVYVPPRAEVLEVTSRNGLRVEFIAIETEEDFWLPAYVLKQPGEQSGRTVIALHGQGRGAADVVGLAEQEHTRKHVQEHQYDYADRWARAGFIVVAPELRGYGRLMLGDDRQRVDGSPAEELWRNSVDRLKGIYLRLGQTYAGRCVADLTRLIDYLEDREDIDADRIGIGGMGDGARVLSWLTAVEDRIGAVAAAALNRADADTLLEPRAGPPAMLDARTLVDHASIFACYVPRPLCLQAGRRDPEMPVQRLEAMADRLAHLYRLCDAEDRLTIDIHNGGRVFKHQGATEFFERWL